MGSHNAKSGGGLTLKGIFLFALFVIIASAVIALIVGLS